MCATLAKSPAWTSHFSDFPSWLLFKQLIPAEAADCSQPKGLVLGADALHKPGVVDAPRGSHEHLVPAAAAEGLVPKGLALGAGAPSKPVDPDGPKAHTAGA